MHKEKNQTGRTDRVHLLDLLKALSHFHSISLAVGANKSAFPKAVIDDVSSRSIDEALQSSLLNLFESAIETVATTLVREAKFDISDFDSAKERGCEGFALLVSRIRADSRNKWFGAFQRGEQRLDVIGHLE